MSTISTAYTAVYAFANHYVPIHDYPTSEGMARKYLARPSTDQKVAEQAAKAFSQKNNILFDCKLMKPKLPIMTVMCKEGAWYPTRWDGGGFSLIKKHEGQTLGSSTMVEATKKAKTLAQKTGLDCDPIIGSTLSVVKYLRIEGQDMTDATLQRMMNTASAEVYAVTIQNCPISGSGLQALSALPKLEQLILKNLPQVTEEEFSALPASHLKYLEVSGLPGISEDFLDQFFITHPNLEQLISCE